MRQRNRLLAGESPDPDWLRALEEAMAEHGAAIGAARAALIDALGAQIAATPDSIFARAALHLSGWDGGDLAADLRTGRNRDAAAGRALAGPHRQDLLVVHAAKGQPAAQSSTGEQKALLLGIVLAHADLVAEARGARPLLLLDEVAAHLDPRRRAALFERLDASGGQVWLTGTEPALFADAPMSACRYTISEGNIGSA
jgi:DNA replication and repair protein RecF